MPCCFSEPPPLMGCKDAPWVGFLVKRSVRRVGNPRTPQPGRERSAAKRSVPIVQSREGLAHTTGRVPSSRRSQLRPAERCPAAEGLKHSSRRTAPGEKDLNTPTPGTGPGTKDLNTPSIRPALPAKGLTLRVGSVPSWANLSVRTRAEGGTLQVSMAGNAGKARQRNHYHRPGRGKRGPAGPTRQEFTKFTNPAVSPCVARIPM